MCHYIDQNNQGRYYNSHFTDEEHKKQTFNYIHSQAYTQNVNIPCTLIGIPLKKKPIQIDVSIHTEGIRC
jgi:hypothetical protein